MSNSMESSDPGWFEFLQNPMWYVAAITFLTGLTIYLRIVWWLTGATALVWGAWLVWRVFQDDQAKTAAEDDPLSRYVDQALIYQTQISQLLKATANERDNVQRQRLAAHIEQWVNAIQVLVQHLARLRHDDLIHQEMMTVPKAVLDVETRLAIETDSVFYSTLERTLINRRKQLAALTQLQRNAEQAEMQIESTLAQLGAIYSHLLTDQATRQVVDYSRLTTEAEEAVNQLQDRLEALWEVKIAHTGGRLRNVA